MVFTQTTGNSWKSEMTIKSFPLKYILSKCYSENKNVLTPSLQLKKTTHILSLEQPFPPVARLLSQCLTPLSGWLYKGVQTRGLWPLVLIFPVLCGQASGITLNSPSQQKILPISAELYEKILIFVELISIFVVAFHIYGLLWFILDAASQRPCTLYFYLTLYHQYFLDTYTDTGIVILNSCKQYHKGPLNRRNNQRIASFQVLNQWRHQ